MTSLHEVLPCIKALVGVKKIYVVRRQWLMPVILATPEAEIRRIVG
jgi:hypothetical protein